MSRAWRVSKWLRPGLETLKPYYRAPLEGDPLRLDQNTHLLGPHPAIGAVDVARLGVDQYPTRDADGLLEALAQVHGVAVENLLAGNGSDELLDLVTRTFTRPGDRLVTVQPSYSLYPFYAKLQDLKHVEVPLTHRFGLDVDALLAAEPDMVILASPNNPTGNRFRTSDLEEIIAGTEGVVLVDEAYIEYADAGNSLLRHVESFDNLVVMRTMSKAYGLAGLRVGYLAANPDLRRALSVVKAPFNLNRYSEAVATLAVADQAWLDQNVASIREERERMTADLKGLGFRVYPSAANFLLTEPPLDADELRLGLQQRSILARTFPGKAGIDHCIRFTVGAPEHTDRLTAALHDILEEGSA